MPITWEGLWVLAAILVMEMEEVLEAKIAWGGQILSRSENILAFKSGFSDTACNSEMERKGSKPQ